MSLSEFPKTLHALKNLQEQFICKTCGKLAENPSTLGGCEHIFCNICCDHHLENNECPVCRIHVSVKDAQVNRQMFNLVMLCQRLEAVLTNQEVTERQGQRLEDVLTDPGVAEEPCDIDGTATYPGTIRRSIEETSYDDMKPSNRSFRARYSPIGKERLDEKNQQSSSNRKSSNHGTRRKRSLPVDQRTMTQMFADGDDDMEVLEMDVESESSESSIETPKKKNKRKKSTKKKPQKNDSATAAQTTMSQFFDYVDESDDDDEDERNNDYCDHNVAKVTGKNMMLCERQIGTKDKKTNVQNSKKSKVVSRNLRTRSKEDKSEVKTTPSSDKTIKTPSLNMSHSTPSSNSKKRNRQTLKVEDATPESSGKNSRSTLSSADATPKSGRTTYVSTSSKSRVQLIREGCHSDADERSRRSLSPSIQGNSASRVKLNSSFTGSGKKSADPLTKRNAKGETPLQVAAIKGDISKIKELLNAGASPNTRDNAGWTPLHEAVHHGHKEIARVLIDHGAMINVPGTENDTPLHDALKQGQLDCVRLLVSRGASLTSRNIHGYTPEDFANTEEKKAALSINVVSSPQPTQEVDVLEYQSPCLLPTGLNREQKILLQKCAAMIHGKVVEEFSPEVTHIVTTCNKDGMCARTFKYMHGVLCGKWIVNFEWVNMCIEYGSKVCEEAFEIPGSSQNKDSHAAEKGRINRKNQLPKLFEGYQFYFNGNFEYPAPNKEDLIDLVKSGGGQILTREPKHLHSNTTDVPIVPYHAPTDGPLCRCNVLVVNDGKSKFEPISSGEICSVSFGWLLKCVGTFKIQQDTDV